MRTKKELRQELIAKLALVSVEDHHRLSQQVSDNLNQLLNDLGVIQKKLVIGFFSPIQREPGWFLKMDELVTAFPAIAEGQMVFKLARRDELLVNRDFGADIFAPLAEAKIVSPDIIIVPGLGFSIDGKRLGRGKGFYDRYLATSPAVKIGVAFEMQIEKDIPLDEHDELMDFVVTDKCIYKNCKG